MPGEWIVLKFGGTSVASPSGWRLVAERAGALRERHGVWIVASALAGVTDRLERAIEVARAGTQDGTVAELRRRHLELAEALGVGAAFEAPLAELLGELERRLEGIRLTGEVTPRLRARILATGELASTRLGAAALASLGLEAAWVDARRLLLAPEPSADEHRYYLANPLAVQENRSRAEAEARGARLVLTQGFLAGNARGETLLLGRGGSDTSAALFAVMLGAKRLEIWTDVPGLFTADPRRIPSARLIRRIGYREAQELAALGARVLHPRCLPPAAEAGIPVEIRSTHHPELEGTRITRLRDSAPAVTAVTCRTGVTLLTLATWAMWETPGFLARFFEPFAAAGISVDLIATSQAAVSVTLDAVPGGLEGAPFRGLLERLRALGTLKVVHPCGVVSIVGRRIRSVLHELGPAFVAFREFPVYLASDSSEDLNLSFVVDEANAPALVARLHERLFAAQGDSARLGPTWEKLERPAAVPAVDPAWWRERRAELVRLAADGRPRYVYALGVVRDRARRLRQRLPAVHRFFYSMKANPHPRVLEALAEEGFGFECVSSAEIERAREVCGGGPAILFTPNFCPLEEYARALELGAELILDGPEPLLAAPELFRGAAVGLRVDPGTGAGHHPKVHTAGAHTKFGTPIEEVGRFAEAAAAGGVRVVGLHAHVGSGIGDPQVWARTGRTLAALLGRFSEVRWLDLGGGLGVAERPGESDVDLEALGRALDALASAIAPRELRLEPGRYLVAPAGVLLAPVTQVRKKAGINFVGTTAGMNSLLRPALYGAWHTIHNLSRLDEEPSDSWHVVGPLCESADVLGRDRWLATPRPGDILLVENAGAYGAVMASRYNLREPAEETAIE